MGSEWARSGHLRSVWSLHWYPSWHLTEQCFELHSTVPSVALLVTLKSSTFSRQTSGGIIFLAVSFPKTGSTGKTTGSSHKELTFIFSKFSFWKFFLVFGIKIISFSHKNFQFDIFHLRQIFFSKFWNWMQTATSSEEMRTPDLVPILKSFNFKF